MNKDSKDISAKDTEQILRSSYKTLRKKTSSVRYLQAFFILTIWLISILLAESVFYLGWEWKSLFLIVALISVFTILRRGKNAKLGSFQDFYRHFSRTSELPELKDALDLMNSSGNQALIDRAILQNLSRVSNERLRKELRSHIKESKGSSDFMLYAQLSAFSTAIFLICIFNFSDAASRTAAFWQSFSMPNPYTFRVTPGDTTLEQGSPFSASVKYSGDIPENSRLMVRTDAEDSYRERPMNGNGNSFRSAAFDLNADMSYYIAMDDFRSPVYRADVQLRPRFRELQASVAAPEYTRLDTTTQVYPFSRINAYNGSVITFSGLLNKPVQNITLTSSSGDSLFSPADSSWNYNYQVAKPDTLRFTITDRSGLTNAVPFQIIISPTADEYPVAEILSPEQNIEEIEPDSLSIVYRTTDDFGISSVRLRYEHRKAFVDQPETGSLSLDRSGSGSGVYRWDLRNLKLKPMDVLEFWVEATDNDVVTGPKTSRSRSLTLSVPSVVDYLDQVGKDEDQVQKGLEEVGDNFEEISKQYQEFKEDLREDPGNDYEKRRNLQQIEQEQQNLEEKIREMNEEFEKIKEDLSANDLVSDETKQLYEELDKLMEEIDDPAFREAIQKLQEQMGQMNEDQLREALENAEFNEEVYKERLQRTIELFKRLKTTSNLEKMARSLEDLAEREKELFEEGNPEKIEEQSEKSEEELEKLDELNKQIPEQSPEKDRQKLEQLKKDLQEPLDQSRQEMQQRQQDQEQPQSQEQKLQEMAQKVRSELQNMQSSQMQINIAGLRYILYSLLEISGKQENLVELTASTENRSQAFIDLAREQRNMEGIFGSLSDSLSSLANDIPQFSNAISKMKLEVEKQLTRSVEQMAERRQRNSSVASRQALGGINEIAFELANLLEQISGNSGSGSGSGPMSMEQMMEQLKESGEQQRQLNQEIQQMINDMQGDRLTRDQMERLDQMARQQNRIRQQLEELKRSGALDEGDQIGSELERMIEEMEDTINDLRGGAADPQLIERQQNILSRMLNAENALQERDEEEKREGSTADPLTSPKPPEMTLEELEKEIRRRLNDPNFTKFSPDYQNLIRKYFELLKEREEQDLN